MGASESTEKLGQRVIVSRETLKAGMEKARQRFEFLQTESPQSLETMMSSVADSFSVFAPFLESTLLIAWLYDPEQCKAVVLKACKKVLRAPIKDEEYKWFQQYVFSSNIWMLRAESSAKYMYEELLAIGKEASSTIVTNMNSIFDHLESHKQWDKVLSIKNKTLVPRQDHDEVGLLKEDGLKNVFEMKVEDSGNDGGGDDGGGGGDDNDDGGGGAGGSKAEDMQNFIDGNLAINMLTATASKLNGEFQRHVRLVMNSHGSFKAAPMKKVERSISKVENDYANEQFPKSAKLLDLVRCSITFNTVEQLCAGYQALVNHATSGNGIISLARVKNGFLDGFSAGGYRDIKVNLIYTSQNPEYGDLKMICEVQLLLINYLEEKKKIHKLYSILREEIYFDMVANPSARQAAANDPKNLKLTTKMVVGQEVEFEKLQKKWIYKSSVDVDLDMVAMESNHGWFGVVDMKNAKPVLELNRDVPARHTHAWMTINGQKYLAAQTSKDAVTMWKVKRTDDGCEFEEDDNYNFTVDGDIIFCEFSATGDHVLLVVNQDEESFVQVRNMKDVHNVQKSIKLADSMRRSFCRNFRLSADGNFCAISFGGRRRDFRVIDIQTEEQHILTSEYLHDTFVPCFINGDSKLISCADKSGRIEIWDIAKKESVHTMQTDGEKWIGSSASVHNILAIGSDDQMLRLYDVNTWQCFYQQKFTNWVESVVLTDDLKYLTVSGKGDEICHVLQIQ